MTENQVSRQEWQLLETIRAGAQSQEFRLSVRHQHGEWLIDISSFPNSDDRKGRGTGESFSAAWNALSTLAIEANPSPLPRESN